MKDEIRDIEVIHRKKDYITISFVDYWIWGQVSYVRTYSVKNGRLHVYDTTEHSVNGVWEDSMSDDYDLFEVTQFENDILEDLKDDFPYWPDKPVLFD
jgi:hypothetical protein